VSPPVSFVTTPVTGRTAAVAMDVVVCTTAPTLVLVVVPTTDTAVVAVAITAWTGELGVLAAAGVPVAVTVLTSDPMPEVSDPPLLEPPAAATAGCQRQQMATPTAEIDRALKVKTTSPCATTSPSASLCYWAAPVGHKETSET
jgi:hypothetical protein